MRKIQFFNYMNQYHSKLVFVDEEDKSYIKVYEYSNELDKEDFAKQTYNITKLLAEFKERNR